MSKEIVCKAATGLSLVAVCLFPNGQTWAGGNTSAPVSNTSIIAHPIALAEQGTTGIYEGDFPTVITSPGDYSFQVFATAGTLSLAEVQAIPLASGCPGYWTGSAIVGTGAAIAAVQASIISFPLATVTGTPTITSVNVTGLTDTTANAYKDAYCLFLSGVNAFAVAFPVLTSTYAAGTTTLTFTGLLAAPAVSDTLILLGSKKSL